jgi:hypothetical protein
MINEKHRHCVLYLSVVKVIAFITRGLFDSLDDQGDNAAGDRSQNISEADIRIAMLLVVMLKNITEILIFPPFAVLLTMYSFHGRRCIEHAQLGLL